MECISSFFYDTYPFLSLSLSLFFYPINMVQIKSKVILIFV